MVLREICKECILHQKKLYDCPYCNIDFNSQQNIIDNLRKLSKHDSIVDSVIQVNKNDVKIKLFKDPLYTAGNKSKECNKKRLFCYIEENTVAKTNSEDSHITWAKFSQNQEKSRRRSLDIFIDYGKNNDFDYFMTITFDPRKVASNVRSAVIYAWKLLRQKFQYYYPGIKLLCVVEYHLDGAKMHFHCLVGGANIDRILALARDNQFYKKNKNGEVIMRNGKPLMNKHYLHPIIGDYGEYAYNLRLEFFNLGFSTIYPLKDIHSDGKYIDRITHYAAKYMAKDQNAVPYNGKRYFATRNLVKSERFKTTKVKISEILENIPEQTVLLSDNKEDIISVDRKTFETELQKYNKRLEDLDPIFED